MRLRSMYRPAGAMATLSDVSSVFVSVDSVISVLISLHAANSPSHHTAADHGAGVHEVGDYGGR